MSVVTSSIAKTTAAISAATSPEIYNVTAVAADTEYSQSLSANTKQFIIRARGSASLKVSFTATETGTKYITVPRGTSMSCDDVDFGGTIYFQSSKASEIVEILEWT